MQFKKTGICLTTDEKANASVCKDLIAIAVSSHFNETT
jgi:hypothetical protein